MRVLIVGSVVVMVLCSGAEAHAQNADLKNLWRHVTTGDLVRVKEASGHQTSGIFAKVSTATLSVMVDGEVLDIPAANVREVKRRGDSAKSGFFIGAGIGAGLGAAALLTCKGTTAKPCLDPIYGAVFGGVIAGGIGTLVDLVVPGWKVVFRAKGTAFALHPSIGASPRSLSASVVVTVPRLF